MSETRGASPSAPPGRAASAGGRRRWLLVAALAAVLAALGLIAVLLADSPGARIARAVDATLAEGSAQTVITATVADLPVVGEAQVSLAEGALDLEAGAARLERELPVLSSLPLPGAAEAGPVELVFVGGETWIRAPLALERSWVRLSGEDPADPTPGRDPASTAPGLGNPLALFGLLQAIEGTPEERGSATVDGVPTDRYRVVVDVDELTGRVADGTAALLDGLERLHPDGEVALDVWIDEGDRIRRLAYEGQLDLAGLTQLRLRTEVELSGFGAPVDISAPGDDEVVDLSPAALRRLDPLARLGDLLEQLPGR